MPIKIVQQRVSLVRFRIKMLEKETQTGAQFFQIIHLLLDWWQLKIFFKSYCI